MNGNGDCEGQCPTDERSSHHPIGLVDVEKYTWENLEKSWACKTPVTWDSFIKVRGCMDEIYSFEN